MSSRLQHNMHILRVFTNEKGEFGNKVGLVLDEGKLINNQERQSISSSTGFSEVVFVNNVKTCSVSIYNPLHEIVFAGHAILGTAKLLARINKLSALNLECKGGKIRSWQSGGLNWICARLDILPPWNYQELKSTQDVEGINIADTSNLKHTVMWAWIDRKNGYIRARTFAPDWNIAEDEANGSGAMKLAAKLGQKLKIIHGRGSIIYADPVQDKFINLGGRVVEDKNYINKSRI